MKKLLFMVLLALGAGSLKAQYLTVTETSAKPPITLDFNKVSIVDINSNLSVQINQNALTSGLAAKQHANPQLTARLNQLLFILRNQQQILQSLAAIDSGAKNDVKKLSNYSRLTAAFYGNIIASPDFRKTSDTILTSWARQFRSNKSFAAQYPNASVYLIKNLTVMMDSLVSQLRGSAALSNIRVQLEAFLNTRAKSDQQVHVENFDNYAAGQYYEVQRWVTSFSQNDVDTFNQLGKVTSFVNQQVNTNFSQLAGIIRDSIQSIQCVTKLVQDAKAAPANAQTEVKAFIDSVQNRLNGALGSLQATAETTSSSSNALQQFNLASGQFVGMTNGLVDSINVWKTKILKPADLNIPLVKTFLADFNNCKAAITHDINMVKNAYGIVSTILKPFQSTAATANAAGNSFNLSLSSIPPIGYIDLKTTGKRDNGDQLVIKLVYRTTDDIQNNHPGLTIEKEVIQLQQVNFYSETNIGVILARPYDRSSQVTLGSKFQFAPAGSILLKFGSRTSTLWNDLSPGFGINISTPDFNLDGSPDVAYGGVVTLFKNLLSVGLSYDIKTSSPFWFFGVSLPFATLGLPLGNVQTGKQP